MAFSAADHACMAEALRLARGGLYSTRPNPRVGCVIARDGAIVGRGFHFRAGEAHAEVHALAAAGAAAAGATVYVTLEPCAHHGRTPPCADALLAAGVARVVYAVPDPNPRVAGGGLTRLAAAGICCEGGLLEGEARALNRGFLQRFTAGRPRVTVKLGMSLDARVALADGRSQWITGAAARADVQRLRALSGAIMTGSGTLLADDPRLDVRDPRFDIAGRPPVRVVLDRLLRTPPTARLFDTAGAVAIFTARPDLPAAPVLRARGAQLESVALRDDGRGLSLPAVLRRLAELEINDVLVEAGPTLVAALLADGLVDELVLYVAPILLGAAAQPAFALAEPPTLAAAPGFDVVETVCLGSDQRLVLRRP